MGLKRGGRGENYWKVVDCLRDGEWKTAADIRKQTKLSSTTCFNQLRTLTKDRRIDVEVGTAGGPKGNNPSNPTCYKLKPGNI